MNSRANAQRAAAQLLNTPVAMDSTSLDRMLSTPVVTNPDSGLETPEAFFPYMYDDHEDGTPYSIRNGVAVISIMGTLFDWRYEAIQEKVQHALENPEAVGILFDIDSGGGSVDGVFDLVDFLFEASKEKPIWSIANHFAASAAYAIASVGKQIGLTRTAGVGSVGVIATHVEFSKEDEKYGWTYTTVFAGARKNDFNRHETLKKTAKDILQSDVNELHDIFIAQVARNRGMSEDDVRSTEAGTFSREASLEVGFADQVTTFDNFLDAFQASLRTPGKSLGRSTTAAHVPHEEEVDTMADDKQSTEGAASGTTVHADADNVRSIDEARSAGANEGRESARAEATEINDLCILAGCPERAGELISSGKSVGDIRAALLAQMAEGGGESEEVSGRHAAGGKTAANTPQIEFKTDLNVSDIYRKRDAQREGYAAAYQSRSAGGN